MHGYAGKILRIDLGTKEVKSEITSDELIKNFLGGNGFGTKILFDAVKEGTEPFDEGNVIVIAPGLFNGTPIPTSGKVLFHFKSPLTNGFGDSAMGAPIGAELKFAGYDAVVIAGKAEKPVYIAIDNDDVEIKDASHLWGKDTRVTQEFIKKEFNDLHISVACIGIAGENLVRYACVDCEDRQAGRSGAGTVFGSKNLKAIAVRGTRALNIAEPERLKEIIAKWFKVMVESSAYRDDTLYGTGEFLNWINAEKGAFPTKNWRESVFKDRKEIDPYYWAPKYSKKNKACFSCIKPCGKLFVIESGKYAGTVVDGPEYETQFSLGSNCGNASVEALAKANELCDLYGVDTISCGGVIGFAMECYERGILTKDELDGIALNFGNADSIPTIVEKIARKEGIGELLAEGVKRVSERIGKGSDEFAIHVKGQEPPAYDVRAIKGLGLAFMTSSRGACHLRSAAYALELTGKFWKFEGVDRFSAEKKGYEIKSMEDFMAVYDSLGVCKFSRGYFFIDGFTEIIEAVTGRRITEEELLKIGERVNNLKRLFNIREGFTRKDDALPKRILSEPIPDGVSKGSYIKPEEAEMMLDDYYNARGWDNDGKPTKEKLEELGLA